MIMFVIFLMMMSYGLGYFTEIVVRNMKELDEIVERNRQEEKKFVEKFKQNVDNIVSEQSTKSTDMNDLKAAIKKKH